MATKLKKGDKNERFKARKSRCSRSCRIRNDNVRSTVPQSGVVWYRPCSLAWPRLWRFCSVGCRLMEFKTGNNFGFCAFTGYGAFWISLCFMVIFGKNPELVKAYPTLAFSANDLGFFLVAWTIFTFILFIASMKHHTVLAIIFLTLLVGFVGLDVKEFTENAAAGKFAAYDLIVCAFSALYLMTVAVYAESGIKLPVGDPWIK